MGVREWFVNEGPMYTFVAVWMVINVALFVSTFFKYRGDSWNHLRAVVHDGLPVARGAAMVLNFNCALILIPVCRNMINFLRGAFGCRRSLRRLFDKNILFHKYCAYTICVATAVHIGAHLFNVNELVTTTKPQVIVEADESADHVAFTTTAGITGVVITFCLILMVTTASEPIRRSYFELFWYTHHLFIVFYAAFMAHGSGGFVQSQTNFKEYPISDVTGRCITSCPYPVPTNSNPCCNASNPTFKGSSAASWMWVVGPLALYLCERLYRLYMSQFRQLKILKIVKHQDTQPVMEVQFQKVATESGQYIFLHCPAVSRFEWHPFTLTSCPELDYCSVHIRLVGDWTTAFADACGFYDTEPKAAANLPRVAIDGPFGTSSEDLFRFEAAVCVAAGIGVTPFASLLQALYFRKFDKRGGRLNTKTVYFYWMCPTFDSWGWFASLLIAMEERCAAAGDDEFLKIRVFQTRGWTDDDARKIALADDDDGDAVIKDAETGRALKQKLNFGRPDWDREFAQLRSAHHGKDVGIFFCGPKAISSALHEASNKFTTADTRFFYHKENF